MRFYKRHKRHYKVLHVDLTIWSKTFNATFFMVEAKISYNNLL